LYFSSRVSAARRAGTARLWWKRMEAKKPTHFGVDYRLAQSALFWIEGRKEEAREAWNKGIFWPRAAPLPDAMISTGIVTRCCVIALKAKLQTQRVSIASRR